MSAFAPADAIARHPKKSPVARHARPGALPSLRRSAISAIELVIDLPFLAGEINDAHRQVTFHARGMLLEAKRAGDALLAAKVKVRHGEFKAWVEANCRAPYKTLVEYMRVSKLASSKSLDLRTFDGGVHSFLEAHAKPRPAAPVTFPALDPEDAERVLKINDRAERGVGAETAVASAKLASIAEGHGLTVDALLERSKAMCPDREKSTGQAASDARVSEAEEAMRASDARLAECEARIERIVQRRAELTAEFTRMTKAELLSTAVELALTVEGV